MSKHITPTAINGTCQGIRVMDAPGDEDLVAVITAACNESLRSVQVLWGLDPPTDCRIYVMTSWWKFFMEATPWPQKPFLFSSFPFWGLRASRTWPYAGAWTQRFGTRVVIGVKPPRLLAVSNKSVGELMYVEQKDMSVKMRHLICHELTHACAAHLRLPAWLNEGIAMLTVDRYLGARSIREDTLDLLREQPPRCEPPSYRQMVKLNARGLALHAVRGYWLVVLMEDIEPGFFKSVFTSMEQIRSIDSLMAKRLGIPEDRFWQQVDDHILSHHR
jgi:hypothetical protein